MIESTLPYEEYIEALKRSDERSAFAAVDRAMAQGMTPEQIYVQVFQPAMVAVGDLWQCNQFHVAEEHLATAITRRLMAQFNSYFRTPRVALGRRLLVGCIEGELHEIGIQMIDDVFYRHGWDVVYLGANVPSSDLLTMVGAIQPTLVGLSSTMACPVPVVKELIEDLRVRCRHTFVAIGGYPFHLEPGLWRSVGADMCADDAVTALQAANHLMEGQDRGATVQATAKDVTTGRPPVSFSGAT